MPDVILHHYEISPYAEKIRLALGLKGLAWRSVQIPIVMPKPDLVALTGGYRLTPVLQLGADVYCDTRCIAAALERLRPEPALVPAGREAEVRALSAWGELTFMNVVILYAGIGAFPEVFVADRQKMWAGGFDAAALKALVPSKRDQVRSRLDLLERQLGAGEPFLMGRSACLADLSVYHPLWGLRAHPELAKLLSDFPRIGEWMERVAGLGHGERSEMDSGEAIDMARRGAPATATCVDPDDPNGRRPGRRVRVVPEDYGLCPVEGELVASDAQEIAIRRRDERAGEVVVHFPREGYLTFDVA